MISVMMTIVYEIFEAFPVLSVTIDMNGWETLFADHGARVPPPPIVPSGTMLNPDGRDVPSPIEKLYGGFPPVTDLGLKSEKHQDIHFS
jgi:hypothetical protein